MTQRPPGQSDASTPVLANQSLQTELANLNAQLAGLRVESDRLQQQLKQATGLATSTIQVKSAEVAVETARIEGDIARVQAQIAAKQVTFPTVPPPANRDRPARQVDPDMAAGMLFVLTLAFVIPLSIAWARRLGRGGARASTSGLAEIAPRLDRLEQAVDSIAIEVERISEGQRFVTKILAEQQPAQLPPSAAR